MFKPRKITANKQWQDESGIKIYTISANGNEVDQTSFRTRLQDIKQTLAVNWPTTAAFVIFHQGASYQYLVLAWWGNDNELFTSVSVKENEEWVVDPAQYSFCLYDMEVMWQERNIYIKTMDCENPSLSEYQNHRDIV